MEEQTVTFQSVESLAQFLLSILKQLPSLLNAEIVAILRSAGVTVFESSATGSGGRSLKYSLISDVDDKKGRILSTIRKGRSDMSLETPPNSPAASSRNIKRELRNEYGSMDSDRKSGREEDFAH